MADTYTLIEKITVGAADVSSVTFTSIPQTYTDLVIKASVRGSNSLDYQYADMIFNNNTSSYSNRFLEGTGASAVSYTTATTSVQFAIGDGNTATTSTFGNAEVYIPNYTGSTNKSVSIDMVSENNATTARTILGAGLWSNTAAITSIKLTATGSTSFLQYSTFYLYGIAKSGVNPAPSSAPYATGGDSIVFDGTYWIHTFTSSGTFTPKKALSCDYLVVAGGGGGISGGGGAGGLRSTVTATGGGGSLESALSLNANTGYTVTIGAGGTGGTSGLTPDATNGSNSVFSTITSTGGGKGGRQSFDNSAANGGSGGGSGRNSTTVGTGTSGQGYAGGAGSTSLSGAPAGGGGGAGAVGEAATSGQSGAGGGGVATSISGSSVTYAGGGGGGGDTGCAAGNGGSGGGGNGSGTGGASAGTANRGGGGGGGYNSGSAPQGGNGGSGIVIVRYAA